MEYTFNEATSKLNINYDRERFYIFMCGVDDGRPRQRLLKSWQDWYHAFVLQINEDARDLADTQADALGVLF